MLFNTSYKMKPPVSARINYGHPLADKLIACYLMQEGSGVTAFDSSGRGHHGRLTGGTVRTIGRYGRAVEVGISSGHIAIADHPDFTPAGTPLSVSFVVYIKDATQFYVASKGKLNVDAEWMFITTAGALFQVRFFDERVDDCYIGQQSSSALTVYQGRWVRLTVTYDGGKLSSGVKMYVNENVFASAASERNVGSFDAVVDLDHAVWLGRYSFTYGKGIIDSSVFWRRVLTQSDIAKLSADPFCIFNGRSKLYSSALR